MTLHGVVSRFFGAARLVVSLVEPWVCEILVCNAMCALTVEPTMGTGNISAPSYAALLNAAYPQIKAADSAIKVVAFAGTPLTTQDPDSEASIPSVLALAHQSMDVLSEHAYDQLTLPDTHFPAQLSGVRAAMKAGGVGDKPIWHSEQGLTGNDDGYGYPGIGEADIAQLYIRDVVTAAANGGEKFFWFSQDVSIDYDFSIFYGAYTPRPRLTALNAAASLIEGCSYKASFSQTPNQTFAHLFEGPGRSVAVIWNSNVAYNLSLKVTSAEAAAIQVFDTMGNEMMESLNPPVSDTEGLTVTSAAERPIFLSADRSKLSSLAEVLKSMIVTPLLSVSVDGWQRVPGTKNITVTLTAREDAVRASRLTHSNASSSSSLVWLCCARRSSHYGWRAWRPPCAGVPCGWHGGNCGAGDR